MCNSPGSGIEGESNGHTLREIRAGATIAETDPLVFEGTSLRNKQIRLNRESGNGKGWLPRMRHFSNSPEVRGCADRRLIPISGENAPGCVVYPPMP